METDYKLLVAERAAGPGNRAPGAEVKRHAAGEAVNNPPSPIDAFHILKAEVKWLRAANTSLLAESKAYWRSGQKQRQRTERAEALRYYVSVGEFRPEGIRRPRRPRLVGGVAKPIIPTMQELQEGRWTVNGEKMATPIAF